MISPNAVKRWLRRDVRDVNRVRRIPLHRLRYLLWQAGWHSDSPDKFTEQWKPQAAGMLCGVKLKSFIAMLPVGSGKAKLGLELIQYRIRKGQTKKALYVTLNDQACGELVRGAKRHTPKLSVKMLKGSTQERWDCRADDAQIYVVSYPGLRNMLFRTGAKYSQRHTTASGAKARGRKFSAAQVARVKRLMDGVNMVVLDEIHECQECKSDNYQGLLRITNEAQIRVGLSATMTGRKPDSLWPLFYLIDRGESLGPTRGLYRAAFFETKLNPWIGIWTHTFRKEMMPELRRLCANRALMYEDNEVGGPKRVYEKVYVVPSKGQMEVHAAVRRELLATKSKGILDDSNFIRLRMIASGFATYNTADDDKLEITFESNPKMDEIIRRIQAHPDRKVIIVHEFRYSGKLIAQKLQRHKIGFVAINGSTPVPAREKAKERFHKNKKCNVFVMNWRVGGAALDFPFAQWMYFFESPVSARSREQCEGRIRRGNSVFKEVNYIDLITRGSVEESVLAYVKEGKDLRQNLLRGGRVKQLELFT